MFVILYHELKLLSRQAVVAEVSLAVLDCSDMLLQ